MSAHPYKVGDKVIFKPNHEYYRDSCRHDWQQTVFTILRFGEKIGSINAVLDNFEGAAMLERLTLFSKPLETLEDLEALYAI